MRYFQYQKLILNRSLVLLFAIVSSFILYAQTSTVSLNGIIKDTNGQPLTGVMVTIQESTVTSISDRSGKFSISASTGDKLTFSYPSYQTITKLVGEKTTKLDIVMTELTFGQTEQDLVPIAYTSKNKRDITSAVSITNFNEFGKRTDMNLMNGLSGLINGLAVMSTGWADTGLGTSFYVRGMKTTNPNNAPLILIDDVERAFGQLNANEIESISVLKDAAALAIYGNRGANGVILIKTKRGKINKRDIIINAQVGVAQSLRLPQFLNGYDYTRLYNEAQTLDGVATSNLKYSSIDLQGFKDVTNRASGANPYKYPNVNFYSEFLKPNVIQQQYDITMTGGNNIARYFTLLGYMNQGGLYKYGDNSFDRFNFRSNIDVKLNSKLDVSLDLAGRIESQTTPGGNYSYLIFGQFDNTPSTAYPIFNQDGSLGGTSNYKMNPYGLMNKMGQLDQRNRFFNADLHFKLDLSDFLSGLSWNGKGGIDFIDGFISTLTSSQFAVYQLLADGTYTNNSTTDVAKTENSWYTAKDRQFSLQTSLNYDKTWKNNRVNALTIFYLREKNSMGISVPYKTVGLASQVCYSYLNKYLLDGTISYTGSENFATGNRFGLFPALSAGWIISDESFLHGNAALSFLKLRASYGSTGLDKPFTDRFLYRENWGTATGYAFGTGGTSTSGIDQLRLGNNNLKWETSYKSDIGLDFGFLNNSLLWTIDGFYDNRKNILVQKSATTPSMAGLPLPYENAGETKSWGFDSEITFDKQINKSLRITVKGNVMLTRSKIVYIDETYKLDAYQYLTGNPIGQPFGYVSNGFFTQDEITRRTEGNLTADEIAKGYNVIQNGGNIHAGDIKYKDLNSDGVIDGRDTKAIASSSIPNLIAGLTLSAKYKLFDFAVQFTGMGERSIYMPGIYSNSFNGGGNASVYALQAWTPETASTAIYPRLSVSNNSNNQQYSDFWFRDGSFIKLKTLEVGFNLPTSLLKYSGISKIRLYINGYNLLCLDHVKDFDPEDTNAAIYSYPMQRIITLGANVTF